MPYRGAAPALNDLLGGHIDAMFDAMPVMVTQAKAGKVTPLAVTSTKRSSALPDVPTIMEAGVPTTRLPAGSASWRRPAPRRRSSSACATRWQRRWRRPTWCTQLDGQGMAPVASQPDAWRAYLASELDVYTKIIRDSNIRPE